MTKKQAKKQQSIYFWTTLLLVILVILVGSQYYQAKHSEGTQEKEVAAYVNGEPITVQELERQYQLIPEQYRLFLTKAQLLDRMINNLLLYQAAKKQGITAENDVRAIVKELRRPFTEDEFKAQIESQNVSYEDYLNDLTMTVTIEKYLMQIIPSLNPNASLLEESYQQYAKTISQPMYKARHILVNDSPTAESIREQLLQGASFDELAKKYSLDPSAQHFGGELGWFRLQDMVPEFSAALEKLKPGEISEPVKTQFGYHIIQLEEVREGANVSKEEVLPYIKFRLFSVLMQQASQDFLNAIKALKANATIQVLYNASDADVIEINSADDLKNIISNITQKTEESQTTNKGTNETTTKETTTSLASTTTLAQEQTKCGKIYFVYSIGTISQEMKALVEGLPEAQAITFVDYLNNDERTAAEECMNLQTESLPQLICQKTGETLIGKQDEATVKAFVQQCLS